MWNVIELLNYGLRIRLYWWLADVYDLCLLLVHISKWWSLILEPWFNSSYITVVFRTNFNSIGVRKAIDLAILVWNLKLLSSNQLQSKCYLFIFFLPLLDVSISIIILVICILEYVINNLLLHEQTMTLIMDNLW